jgi:hypothetical protein
MSEINHFKVFVLCSGNVTADVDHLHVKRIQLVALNICKLSLYKYTN